MKGRVSTPKQQMALRRGNDIRMTRGCLALMQNIKSRYPSNSAGLKSLTSAITFLEQWHNLQFGYKKCKECGRDIFNPNSDFCNEECFSKYWDKKETT